MHEEARKELLAALVLHDKADDTECLIDDLVRMSAIRASRGDLHGAFDFIRFAVEEAPANVTLLNQFGKNNVVLVIHAHCNSAWAYLVTHPHWQY